MRSTIARQWIRALTSGKIKRRRRYLGGQDGSRCCLGVLCDLAVKAKVIPPPIPASDRSRNLCYGGGEIWWTLLPPEVISWAGLCSPNGMLPPQATAISLAAMNDGGSSFRDIAATIKKFMEDL